MKTIKDVYLKPKDLLIEPMKDFHEKKEGEFNTKIKENIDYNVGKIVLGGAEIPTEVIGKTIYYMKNIGTNVDIPEIGKYELVNYEHTYLIF